MTLSIDAQSSLRELLQAHYHRVRARNLAYSMRALARDLGLSSAALSEFFRGKRSFSQTKALELLQRTGHGEEVCQELAELFESRKKSRRKMPLQSISHEDFEDISHWAHFAILALMETQDFRSDLAWIARKLGLAKTFIQDCLDRLIRLELVRTTPSGKFVHTGHQYAGPSGVPSQVIRAAHQTYLELARSALQLDVEHRDFGAATFAIDPKRLPKAKKMLTEFQRKLVTYLESGKKEEVYILSHQLFPIHRGGPKSLEK